MNTESRGVQVEIDASIRARPDLFEAVQRANSRLVERSAYIGPNVRLDWRLSPANACDIELAITDDSPVGRGFAKSQFPSRFMFDAFNRDHSVWRVWDKVLDARLKNSHIRLSQLIPQIEAEESRDAQAVNS
ncbi:MAG TPA: hypothetical protein VN641_02450 [Urbifossiella sp.]|nr:hypothetical protein [Urbifossiella sp.]